MKWESSSASDGGVAIPDNWLFIHYYEALNVLFRVENGLRLFVYVILKKEYGSKWEDVAVTQPDGATVSIRSIASKRVRQAEGFGYLGYATSAPLMHLSSGELGSIIFSGSHWNLFKSFFRARQEVLKTKLDEIGTIRNSLAHFRPIKPDDIELIKQNSKHVLIDVEDCLAQVMGDGEVVPTNTKDEWYCSLQKLSSKSVRVRFLQSKNEEWVRIVFYVRPDIRNARFYSDDRAIVETMNVKARSFISDEIIRGMCIYCSDEHCSVSIKDTVPEVLRVLSLCFSRSTLVDRYEEINTSISVMVDRVQKELELVKSDRLARGVFVESMSLYGKKIEKSDYWNFNTESVISNVKEGDCSEYWGHFSRWAEGFIVSIDRFPWMTSSISESSSPF